ncbi:MAG: hypothetical protein IKE41_02040, partial [Clostridia bacterium]|nr:hypothetical protein [Clostridia bacterium]MBR2734947.1 hypothetical protein [Clostridia bacterium]
MSLVKKIVSCSLALSIALGGVYAQHTKSEQLPKKSNTLSQSAKNWIIGGTSTVGGVALAATLFFTVKHFCTNKLSVLIVGGTAESRKKIRDMFEGKLKANFQVDTCNRDIGFLKQVGDIVVAAHKLKEKISNPENIHWTIEDCDATDPNVRQRTEGKQLVIAVCDNDKTDKALKP